MSSRKMVARIINKIKNIFKGWYYKLFQEEEDLANTRLPICNQCEHRVETSIGYVCGECGCVLDAKSRVAEEHCDLGKW